MGKQLCPVLCGSILHPSLSMTTDKSIQYLVALYLSSASLGEHEKHPHADTQAQSLGFLFV